MEWRCTVRKTRRVRHLLPLFVVLLLLGAAGIWLLRRQIIGFDAFLNGSLGAWRQAPLLGIFVWLTALGSAPAVSVAAVTATGFLAATRQWRVVLAIWIAFLGAATTTWTIKYLVGRARPEFIDAASAVSPSFPSAHSSSAMAVYGFLGLVISQRYSRWQVRFAIVSATAGVILLIGFSRLFLSVHYLTDVLVGLGIGGMWLLIALRISCTKARPMGSPPD